jgi:hypothetical protein
MSYDSVSRDHLIVFIWYNNKSSFLGDTMNMNYPITLFDMINDTCIKKANDLVFLPLPSFQVLVSSENLPQVELLLP